MPELFPKGIIKNGYQIIEELSRGAFAIAYKAKSLTGERVFFKQYKFPTPIIDWFDEYVTHQQKIKKCIQDNSETRSHCYKIVEFFEDNYFYQVFEFINGSKTLAYCFEHYYEFTWADRLTFAKDLMLGVKALHDHKIVHCDIKPDNLILMPDTTVDSGYILRIIDLDWSFFSDKQAPWHGLQGYVGTSFYMSPEHIDDKTPSHASDIFSCGIVLGQLLAGEHPFHKNLDDSYEHAAFMGHFSPIKIKQSVNEIESPQVLENTLNACLNPNPAQRPTAKQVCDVLICQNELKL